MDRLDEFHVTLLSEYADSSNDLAEVRKACLILPHGNACVESGFSLNDSILETLHQTAGDKHREERKRISKEISEI